MKNIMLVLILLQTALLGFSQSADATKNCAPNGLQYEVNLVHPPLAISKIELDKAETIKDLNPHYKTTWVRKFISVEISANQGGIQKKAFSENDKLTKAQKELMQQVDEATEITVLMQYIPENTLPGNEPKTFDFKFLIEPEKEATYFGGEQALLAYLKENAINKLSASSFEQYDLATIKFIINEKGEIENPHIFGREYRKSDDEVVDRILLDAIRKMPCWKAAEYANGLKVKQEFALTVGNHESCVINLINVRRDWDTRKE